MAVKVAKKLVHLTEGTKKISKAKKKKKSIIISFHSKYNFNIKV